MRNSGTRFGARHPSACRASGLGRRSGAGLALVRRRAHPTGLRVSGGPRRSRAAVCLHCVTPGHEPRRTGLRAACRKAFSLAKTSSIVPGDERVQQLVPGELLTADASPAIVLADEVREFFRKWGARQDSNLRPRLAARETSFRTRESDAPMHPHPASVRVPTTA